MSLPDPAPYPPPRHAKSSDTQEMLLTSLVDAPNPLERALGQGSGDTKGGFNSQTSTFALVTASTSSLIISSCKQHDAPNAVWIT